jgi:hypothetical protein
MIVVLQTTEAELSTFPPGFLAYITRSAVNYAARNPAAHKPAVQFRLELHDGDGARAFDLIGDFWKLTETAG